MDGAAGLRSCGGGGQGREHGLEVMAGLGEKQFLLWLKFDGCEINGLRMPDRRLC
jgi:hypothetical protein